MGKIRGSLRNNIFMGMLGTGVIIIISFLFITVFLGVIFLSFCKPDRIYFDLKAQQLVDNFVEKSELSLLNKNNESKIINLLKPYKVFYQVTDAEGKEIYGNIKGSIYKDKYEMRKKMNIEEQLDNFKLTGKSQTLLYYPIFDSKNNLKGSLVIIHNTVSTTLHIMYFFINNDATEFYNWMMNITFFMPFVLIIIFSIIYASYFKHKIDKPVNELMEGAQKIMNKDLDFMISYREDNELGRLAEAFEMMRQELKKSLYEQWKTDEDRKEMIKILAHDLKTPVTVIRGHIEVLEKTPSKFDDRYPKYLTTIKENSNIIANMAWEINAVTELEKAEFKLNKMSLEIGDFLDSKINDYSILCRKNGINFIESYVDNRSKKELVNVDPVALERILNNIVSNSVRYTPEGKNIYLDVVHEDSKIIFTVRDEGEGFKKDINKIFEKFYREDPTRNVQKGHCGLGLYITKRLVEKHDGEISAENHPEGGAVMKFFVKS